MTWRDHTNNLAVVRDDHDSGELHQARLRFVMGTVLDSGVESLLDMGCGSGTLLRPAVDQPGLRRIVGMEAAADALVVARRELAPYLDDGGRIILIHGSCLERHPGMEGCEAVTLVEVIEHMDPTRLAVLEETLFGWLRPRIVLITTPNRDYNPLYGLHPGEFRDPDHRFEWSRGRFRAWALRLAKRNDYELRLAGIGEAHPDLGCPTQAAVLTRRAGG